MAQQSGGNSILTLGILAVAGYFVYEWFCATPAAAAPATVPAAGTTAAPVTGTTTGNAAAPTTLANGTVASLDSIFVQLKGLAQTDPNYTGKGDNLSGTPYHWQTDLNVLLPNNSINLGALFPNIDLTQPMTAASFWATVGPYLHTTLGLSGFGALGAYAGMGAIMQGVARGAR